MPGAGYYTRLGEEHQSNAADDVDVVGFLEAVDGESRAGVYVTIKNLTAVNTTVTDGGINELPGSGLSATSYRSLQGYITNIIGSADSQQFFRNSDSSLVEPGVIAALEEEPDGFLAQILFEIYRYNIDNANSGDPASRSVWAWDGTPGTRILPNSLNALRAFAEFTGVDHSRADGPMAAEDVEEITGQNAVAYLLNRQQGVLATINERIIEQHFEWELVCQDHVVPVSITDEAGEAGEAFLINQLLRRPNLRKFFAIRTPYLSLLVPKIRLYKKVYEREDDGTYTERAGDHLLEFEFKSFTENAKIQDITTFGRAGGVGIKSANWSYEGTNPETVKSLLNFDLSLYFQSLSDLVTGNADVALRDEDSIELINLIGAGIGVRNQDGTIRYKFEIIAQLGWELDQSINHDLASDQNIGEIKDIIKETNINMRLSMREHNISFNEDGSLVLDISYVSAIDETLSSDSLNVLQIGLPDSSAIEDILGVQAGRLTEGASGNSAPELDPCRISRSVTTGEADSEEEEEEDGPTAEEIAIYDALTQTNNDNIIQNYNNIFSRILENNKIYRVTINADEVIRAVVERTRFHGALERRIEAEEDPLELQRAVQRQISRTTVLATYFTEQTLRNISTNAGLKVESIITEPVKLITDAEREAIVALATEAGTEAVLSGVEAGADFYAEVINRYTNSDASGNTLKIDFIRLGDLLDSVIGGLKEIGGSPLKERPEDFVFLTGLYKYRETSTSVRKAYNYSDMLISIDSFRAFFIEKIVRPLKVKYSLVNFIRDLAKDFSYVNAIKEAVEENFVSGEGRPTFSTFRGPDLGWKTCADAAADAVEALPNINIAGLEPVYVSSLPGMPATFYSADPQNEVSYFILRSSGDIVERKGDEVDDALQGIYHLKIGSDRGILKSINFRRDEIAGRREGRIARAGGLNLTALREKYDATITIFGAPFIHPGMFIYINPYSIGYGTSVGASSAAQVLGLGGYYFVNKVRNSISGDGTFETEIEASWNSFADNDCGRSRLDLILPPTSADYPIERAGPAPAPPAVAPTQQEEQERSTEALESTRGGTYGSDRR